MATYQDLLEERRASRARSRSRSRTDTSLDLSTTEGLRSLAAAQGFDLTERKVEEEKKLSVLQRLTRGLSAFEISNALYESRYEGKNFAVEYVKDIFQEMGSAVTGRELQDDGEQKKTFKDILVMEGMKDREGKLDWADVLGFAGDVLLDPTTYFGGAMVKGAGRVAGTGIKAAERAGMKVAPQATFAARGLFDAAKDAGGRAFVYGYGTSEGLADETVDFINELYQKGAETGISYKKLFEGLSPEVKQDLGEGLYKFRSSFGKKREELIQAELKKSSQEMNQRIRNEISKIDVTDTAKFKPTAASIARRIKKEYQDEAFKKVNRLLIKEFDAISPTAIFKDPESVRFFSKTLLPELQKNQKVYASSKDIAEDMILQTYFPLIPKNTVKNFNHAIRVSGKGYNKALKGILGKDEVILDPIEAYTRRALQVEKDLMTEKQLAKWVDAYGVPKNTYKTAEEALKDGYVAIRKQGIRGEVVGYLKEADARFIKEIYDPSFKVISDLAKATGFDAMTNLFKKSVTGLFPAFHTRNWVSGMIQNYETLGVQTLNPGTIATAQEWAYKILRGIDIKDAEIAGHSTKEVVPRFTKRFGISSQYISDFGGFATETSMKTPSKFNPFTYTRVIGNYVETQQKLVAYITALKKGYSIDDALKFAERAGFDYSKLTPFEKNIMRRLIPFYSFSRKNLELQLRTLTQNPERLGILTKAGRAAGTPTGIGEEDRVIPDWMRNRFMANFGESAYGLPQVLSGFGTPIEEQADLLEDGLMGALSRLNPIIRVPLERATGKDFFREQDLKDSYSATEYAEAPQFLKDWLQIYERETPVYKGGEPTGEMRTVYVANPERLQFARAMFTSRGFTFIHTLFGEAELDTKGRILKSLTGFKPYELDEEATLYFEDRDNYRDLVDFLSSVGVVKEFRRAYIPD